MDGEITELSVLYDAKSLSVVPKLPDMPNPNSPSRNAGSLKLKLRDSLPSVVLKLSATDCPRPKKLRSRNSTVKPAPLAEA